MTVTIEDTPPGRGENRDTVEITCAPRYDGTKETIQVPRAWRSVAEKLVAAGRERRQWSSARQRPGLQRLNEAWERIRTIWWEEAVPLGMSQLDCAMLLGISRQGLDNILSYKVGGKGIRLAEQVTPAARPGTQQIREWAKARGITVSEFGPLPHAVTEAYAREMNG